MNVDRERIKNRGIDVVSECGVNYRDEGCIQQLDRFSELVTATISGSKLYDMTAKFGRRSIDTRCTCPYDGGGDCKHIVAVLPDIVASPSQDESECVGTVIDDVSVEDLRGFACDALAEYPELRKQFLICFDDDHRSVREYCEEIAQLFERHADPVVFETTNFLRFLEIAEQYRGRERYLAAATICRAVSEEIDERHDRVDGTYDHYTKVIQIVPDGHVDCAFATNPTPEEFDTYVGMLEVWATAEPRIDDEQFRRALDGLEERYE